jgi:hypothetical protein
LLSAEGRILRENDPDRSPGPRAFFAGCAEGNLCHLHQDLPPPVADEAAALFAAEPAWVDPDARPACLDRAADRLGSPGAAASCEISLIYALPHHPAGADPGRFVCSGTNEGQALLADLRRTGMPRHMVEAGFLGLADFWEPWCMALEDGVIAAIAFAARLGDRGAAVGVYTFPGFRGRGLAAAVTERWSSLPALSGRMLFYSTTVSNRSSQGVAARLGLQRFGMGVRIG